MGRVAVKWRRGLEEWERPLVAAAVYTVDPRPEEEVFGDMVGRGRRRGWPRWSGG